MSRRRRHRADLRTRRWRAFRRPILIRDGYRCRSCGRPGRLEVDHVVPVHLGGAVYDPQNAQALCRRCHFAKSAAESRARTRGRPPVDVERRREWRDYVRELARE